MMKVIRSLSPADTKKIDKLLELEPELLELINDNNARKSASKTLKGLLFGAILVVVLSVLVLFYPQIVDLLLLEK